MSREIILSAFLSPGFNHQSQGLWRREGDRSLEYTSLDYWVDLARLLEANGFDTLFISDSFNIFQIYGDSIESSIRYGVHVPRIDPTIVIGAMAHATKNLGFGVTSNALHEPPYQFARRMSTLDHMTRGRIGWNIVTGHSEYGARAVGQDLLAHDDRYDVADEYLSLMYQLWEGSWEDDAVLADRASGDFADPSKVHTIDFEGRHFAVKGVHAAQPSPQRTPLLFQAGTSTRGRDFAATHAECVFVAGPNARVLAPRIASVRERAVAHGRAPQDVRFLAKVIAIVGETEEEAKAKYEDYRRYINLESALVMFSGLTGIDFSKQDLDAPVVHQQQSQGIHSALEAVTTSDPTRVWTLREIAERMAIGGNGPMFIGSTAQVADEIERFIEESGADGINLTYATFPGDYEAFGRLVVPELRRRGRLKADYRPGTLREKLFGHGARLEAPHPAASARRSGS